MAETRPEPFARRAARARGAEAPGPVIDHIIPVPACAVPIFVFLHIPKTAGTTMRGLFNEIFGPYFHLFAVEQETKRDENGLRPFQLPGYFDNVMLIAGHFHRTHAVVRAITGRRIVFISVMRDPVKRVVSHYDYLRRMPHHRLNGEVRDRTLLEAFSTPGLFRNACENEQMRIMFGPKAAEKYEEMLLTNNYIIGTLENLAEVSRAVSTLSGMPPVAEVPRYNQIEELGGEEIVRAKDQPGFAEAMELIREVNQFEYGFYNRVRDKMIYTTPDWLIEV
jgi:hypothetical protein